LRSGESYFLKHISLILCVIVLQAAFGMWTVTLKLWPQVVTAHLLGGFTTLSLYYLLWLRSKPVVRLGVFVSFKAKLFVSFVFVLTIIQIFLGGWMASNYAAFACPDLPLCQGEVFPNADYSQGFNLLQGIGPTYLGGLLDGEARVAIHFAHRIGAFILMLAVSSVGFYIFNKNKKLACRLLFVLLLQISLGLANVWFHIPIQIAVLHNLAAALLLIHMLEVLYVLMQAKEEVDDDANECIN
jgi:cytochrome c oxidase assembly protein subunit 15